VVVSKRQKLKKVGGGGQKKEKDFNLELCKKFFELVHAHLEEGLVLYPLQLLAKTHSLALVLIRRSHDVGNYFLIIINVSTFSRDTAENS